MKHDYTAAAIGLYIFLIAAYWFIGDDSVGWAHYYYFVEKSFGGFVCYLLYSNSRNRFIRDVALYCLSLCVFMLGYFVFTMRFGHSTYLTVGSFLVYSFVILTYIRVKS